jgi:hypothetical protein
MALGYPESRAKRIVSRDRFIKRMFHVKHSAAERCSPMFHVKHGDEGFLKPRPSVKPNAVPSRECFT